ncbi:MAG: hypothetical protein Q8M94_08690 [Ignavibacteria bacterium]|nr:hypothetical protein [Ignavibacteria bacterium]
MSDMSYLDKKYFIDDHVYNCPFCNRNNVAYTLRGDASFDWSNSKKCYIYFITCDSCGKRSLHLSYEKIIDESTRGSYKQLRFLNDIDIDSSIFYSVPTSFFVLDDRIPRILRELISESEGCIKMNFLTGASACMRKAIYELLILEKVNADSYEDKIKSLKKKYPDSDPSLFDILSHIQQMTSDKIHEQSWDKWDTKYLRLIIETLKTALYDIYVVPEIKKERSSFIQKLRKTVIGDKDNNSST